MTFSFSRSVDALHRKTSKMAGEAPTHDYNPPKRRMSYTPGPIGPRPPELDDFVSDPGITFKEKMIMKVKQNPFVPIGAAATVAALSMGIYNLQTGNSRKQQFFMRARVGAQAFTVVALLLGVAYHKKGLAPPQSK